MSELPPPSEEELGSLEGVAADEAEPSQERVAPQHLEPEDADPAFFHPASYVPVTRRPSGRKDWLSSGTPTAAPPARRSHQVKEPKDPTREPDITVEDSKTNSKYL